jgi:hypothetical protein
MTHLSQVEYIETNFPKGHPDTKEASKMECGRLIHAAVISRRFLDGLLTDPIRSIESGYCGEKFSFTREEKQRIKHIRASNLAEFSSQLMQVIEMPVSFPAVPEMAFAQ